MCLRQLCVFKQAAKSRMLSLMCVAEEEGFDSAQYEGGTRWHALGRYTRNAGNKGFRDYPLKQSLFVTANSA